MACWYFNKKNIDIAIMETGLGGRLDSTSICNPIVTVITPISLDHMEILGETVMEIAIEKAGAIKKDVPCLSARQKNEVTIVLKSEAEKKGAPLHFLNGRKRAEVDVNIPGEKQKENTELALTFSDVITFHTALSTS